MDTLNTEDIITDLKQAVESLVPRFLQDPAEFEKSKGNYAFCIIDEEGNTYGKFDGPDKIRARELYRIAWTKASQVYFTGIETGEFEKKYFSDPANVNTFGIKAPELIGWHGGQPLHLKNGTVLFVGFSGFSGAVDIKIMQQALADIEAKY